MCGLLGDAAPKLECPVCDCEERAWKEGQRTDCAGGGAEPRGGMPLDQAAAVVLAGCFPAAGTMGAGEERQGRHGRLQPWAIRWAGADGWSSPP